MHKISVERNVKIGVILSYVFIIINSIYGLVITPYVVGRLGNVEYGVYKTIASLSSSMMVLDLGLGGTVTRYLASYIAKKKNNQIESFISMAMGEGSILIVIIGIVCFFLYQSIPSIYADGLDSAQIKLAQQLFIVLALNICFHIIENLLNGIISGFNRFAFGNSLKLIRIIFRIVLTIVILAIYRSALALVLIDLLLTIFLIVVEYIYVRTKLGVSIKLSYKDWDKGVFLESFKYTGLLFLTSIAAQVNSNLDNVVIGAEMGATFVTIYSMGLTIFAMFENLSTAVSGVMLPTITNAIEEDATGKKVEEIVIAAGRVQFLLLGAVFVGFIVLGKDFINLWLGEGFQDVYIIALLLMGPSLLELCVNVCLSILRAKNMLGFRTMVLMCSTVMNAIITIIGVRIYGYFAAAIGTGLSFIVGSVIVMNIYYFKQLKINMLQVYTKIFNKIWICIILSGFIVCILSRFISGSWLSFIFNCILFVIIYVVSLYFIGLNENEKKIIFFGRIKNG